MAQNAVSQRYVVGKQRRNLIAISCKFGYSFLILIQNFELLIELTLRLLMSYIYIYGAPSKARNANVVYIWTYVWQR